VSPTNLTGGGGLFYSTSIPVRPPSALHNIVDATHFRRSGAGYIEVGPKSWIRDPTITGRDMRQSSW